MFVAGLLILIFIMAVGMYFGLKDIYKEKE